MFSLTEGALSVRMVSSIAQWWHARQRPARSRRVPRRAKQQPVGARMPGMFVLIGWIASVASFSSSGPINAHVCTSVHQGLLPASSGSQRPGPPPMSSIHFASALVFFSVCVRACARVCVYFIVADLVVSSTANYLWVRALICRAPACTRVCVRVSFRVRPCIYVYACVRACDSMCACAQVRQVDLRACAAVSPEDYEKSGSRVLGATDFLISA